MFGKKFNQKKIKSDYYFLGSIFLNSKFAADNKLNLNYSIKKAVGKSAPNLTVTNVVKSVPTRSTIKDIPCTAQTVLGKDVCFDSIVKSDFSYFPLSIPVNTNVFLAKDVVSTRQVTGTAETRVGFNAENLLSSYGTTIVLYPIPDKIASSSASMKCEFTPPYILIERRNEIITVYIYGGADKGEKLLFNIDGFESFMMNTEWYRDKSVKDMLGMVFGLEIDLDNASFVTTNGHLSDTPFDVQFAFADKSYTTPGYIMSRATQPNQGILANNKVITIKKLTQTDFTDIKTILQDLGFKI